MNIGKAIVALCKAKGITRKELAARRCGFSKRHSSMRHYAHYTVKIAPRETV